MDLIDEKVLMKLTASNAIYSLALFDIFGCVLKLVVLNCQCFSNKNKTEYISAIKFQSYACIYYSIWKSINCTDLSSTSVCLVNKFIVIVARIFNHAWSNTPKGDWDNPTGGWIKVFHGSCAQNREWSQNHCTLSS